MKKLVFVALIVSLMLSASAFAADLSVKGVLTQTISLDDTSKLNNSWGLAKSRLTFGLKADDTTSVVLITKIDGADGLGIDYAFADVLLKGLGVARVGTLLVPVANFGGGIYQTNTFLGLTAVKGTGVGLKTVIEGYTINVMNIGGVIQEKVSKQLAVKVDSKVEGIDVGVAAIMGMLNDKSGFALEAEAAGTIEGIKVSAQIFADLSDDAAAIIGAAQGAATKRTLLGVYAEYELGACGVYADYVSALSGGAKALLGKSEISIGASHKLNAKTKIYLELRQVQPISGDALGYVDLGAQVSF